MNIFEAASRKKLTFNTPIGAIRTDDLWDLPLQHPTKANLDSIAQAVDKTIRETSTTSFVSDPIKDHTNELRLDILKYIIAVKIEDAKAAEEAVIVASKRKDLLAALSSKEQEQYANMSVADIQKALKKL